MNENNNFNIDITCADSPLPCASSPICANFTAMLLENDGCEVGYESDGERFNAREVNPPEIIMHRSVYEPATTPN